jgi:SOS-response transcriptional repressor LexA
MDLFIWDLRDKQYKDGYIVIVHAINEKEAWKALYRKDINAWFEAHNKQSNPIGYNTAKDLKKYLNSIKQFKTVNSINPKLIRTTKAIITYEGE